MLGKKKAETFVVPSLADVDATYADLLDRRNSLHTRQAELRARKRELEATIAKMPEPAIRASVAALLGDPSDGKLGLREELRNVVAESRDVDAAIEVIGKRIEHARSKASVAVCERVEPEYRRRVAAVREALRAVAEAREHFHELIDALEIEDVRWARLGPITLGFLGDRRDGHIERFIRENAHA